jgi:hypothetical protein
MDTGEIERLWRAYRDGSDDMAPFRRMVLLAAIPGVIERIRELEAREAETRDMLATYRTLCEQEQRAREAAEAQLATARDAALEEAACVADVVHRDACPQPSDVYGQYPYRDGRMDAADDIGSDIRALKAPTPAVSDLGGLAKREAAK